MATGSLDQALGDGGGGRSGCFFIDADHLLVLRQNAGFQRGAPCGVGNRFHRQSCLLRQAAEQRGVGIIAAQAKKRRAAAIGHEMEGHIGRPAQRMALAGRQHHRHRCFRRDARHMPVDIAINDHVADDECAHRAQPVKAGGEQAQAVVVEHRMSSVKAQGVWVFILFLPEPSRRVKAGGGAMANCHD